MERQQRQWRIAEGVADAIIVLDKNRVIQFANQAAARLADLEKASDLVGQSYIDIVKQHRVLNEDGSPADPRQFPSEIALRDGTETRDCIYSEINRKGTHHWISVSAFPLPEETGESKLVAVILEDISRRKLREDKLRFLIESSKILSITTDLNTRVKEKARLLIPALADWVTVNVVNEDGTLTRLAVEHRNRQKTLLVERFAALAAQDPHAVIHRVARTGSPELIPIVAEDSMQAPMNTDEQAALARELRPCSALIVPIRSTDHILGVLSLAYTQESGRHFTEEDIEFMEEFGHHLSVTVENARLYYEIAKKDAAKDAFLATLSHELRNPLAPIKNALDLIRIKNADPDLAHDIEVIDHQFDHMELLLRDLLDVTRFTLGKLKLNRTLFDLTALVRTVISTYQPILEAREIECVVELPDTVLRVEGDSVRIEQVCVNLLNNAEKFTPQGRITVALKRIGNNAIFTVTDTGVGISETEIGKIFEQYFQGSQRAPHQGTGLGMGLVLVREIVRLHSGSVYAKSEGPGKGSIFTVTLPLAQKMRDATPRATDSAAPSKSQKILVIDDNKHAADALVKLLSAVGYQAAASYSGSEGIDSFGKLEPDHVIIDIGMPDINGYDVARQLRERHGANAHLIALSGYGMDEDIRKAREAGFNHHLTKPVGLADLRTTLETTP